MNIKFFSGSWHHKQFMVRFMETVEGQVTLKTKVKIFSLQKVYTDIP